MTLGLLGHAVRADEPIESLDQLRPLAQKVAAVARIATVWSQQRGWHVGTRVSHIPASHLCPVERSETPSCELTRTLIQNCGSQWMFVAPGPDLLSIPALYLGLLRQQTFDSRPAGLSSRIPETISADPYRGVAPTY